MSIEVNSPDRIYATGQPLDITALPILHAAVVDGAVHPVEAGLVEPLADLSETFRSQGMRALVEEITYVQPRVDRIRGGIVEKDFIKLQTMYNPTESGLILESLLGHMGMAQKDISAWRIANQRLRDGRGDELPQLAFNVMGLMPELFPNILRMSWVGGYRPAMASEIQNTGDNSNDDHMHAIEVIAKKWGQHPNDIQAQFIDSYSYNEKGLFTPATAKGHTQLSDVDGRVHYIEGGLEYARIRRMPRALQVPLLGRIAANSIKHVLQGSDAA